MVVLSGHLVAAANPNFCWESKHISIKLVGIRATESLIYTELFDQGRMVEREL